MMRTILWILLVVTAHAGVAQDIYNKARASLSVGDTAAAVAGFEDALKARQKVAESNYHLGAIVYARGKVDDAIRYLKASLEVDDENVDALKLLGDAFLDKNDVSNALVNYQSAANLEPKDPEVAAAFGIALLAADSIDAAIVHLSRAKESAPDNPALYVALGDAYLKQRVTVLGISNYQKAVELDPNNFETRFKLAQTFENDKQYKEAVKEYRAIQEIDSTFAEAYFQEGSIWYRAKQYRNALSPLKKYIHLRPESFEGTLMYAQALSAANDHAETAKIAFQALGLNSTAVETWRLYFHSLVEIKDFDKAESALKSLQKRGALEVDDYLKLGKMYFGLKKEEEALDWYLKAIEVDSANCDPYFNLGSLYMKKQMYAEAAKMFERKIVCNPHSLSSYLNAGASYMQTKNYGRARELFLKSIELKSDYLQGRLWLARYYSQVDSLDNAVEQYDEVLKEVGGDPSQKKIAGEAHSLKGTAYFIKQQYSRAIDSYSKALANGYENASVHLSLGQAVFLTLDPKGDRAENRKKTEEAVKHFRRCIVLESGNPQGHLWLGQGLIQLRIEGENELNKDLTGKACAEFKKTLKLDPGNEDAKKAISRYGC